MLHLGRIDMPHLPIIFIVNMCDFGYITVFRFDFDFSGIIGLACPGIMVLSLISSMRSSNLSLIFESLDLFMISLHLGG